MFQRILVPLDGSLRAERALPIAAHIARVSQGMLVLLRVVNTGVMYGPDVPSQAPFIRTMSLTPMDEAQQYLTAIASSQTLAGISLTVAALPGLVLPTIQTAIHTYQADLLILCAPNDPHEQFQFIGGLAGRLIEHLDIPLLLIPERGSYILTSHADQHHQVTILVAFDGSRPERYLIEPATSLLTALAGQRQRHLHFVPIHSVNILRLEQPAASKQTSNHSMSLPGAEAGHLSYTPAVLLKEGMTDIKRGSGEQHITEDLFVLEIPAKQGRATWISEVTQQLFLSKGNIPLFFVPSSSGLA